MITFEQWSKDRPVGPKNSLGYLMIKAAWEDSKKECANACEKIALKHSVSNDARSSGKKAGALECHAALAN